MWLAGSLTIIRDGIFHNKNLSGRILKSPTAHFGIVFLYSLADYVVGHWPQDGR